MIATISVFSSFQSYRHKLLNVWVIKGTRLVVRSSHDKTVIGYFTPTTQRLHPLDPAGEWNSTVREGKRLMKQHLAGKVTRQYVDILFRDIDDVKPMVVVGKLRDGQMVPYDEPITVPFGLNPFQAVQWIKERENREREQTCNLIGLLGMCDIHVAVDRKAVSAAEEQWMLACLA